MLELVPDLVRYSSGHGSGLKSYRIINPGKMSIVQYTVQYSIVTDMSKKR
jgi:hypothetical protein